MTTIDASLWVALVKAAIAWPDEIQITTFINGPQLIYLRVGNRTLLLNFDRLSLEDLNSLAGVVGMEIGISIDHQKSVRTYGYDIYMVGQPYENGTCDGSSYDQKFASELLAKKAALVAIIDYMLVTGRPKKAKR